MNDSLELAEAFLQEAVFRSRAVQAAGTALAQLANDKQRQCGLGAEAAIELDLTPRALELAQQLWPGGLDGGRVATLRRVMAAWIERQDALDRERNHFLKAFRKAHGFDRRAFSAEQLAEYENGLAAINAQADAERRAAAVEVLA
ncbi:MAG: hypothetical protein JNN27_20520 [Planctomycetes bacterium]|nr:hypothetical protein [Planctomycetota bacterium]